MDNLTIYTSGVCRGNPGPAAAAWIILRGSEILETEVRLLGDQTSNIAGFTALRLGLSAAKKYSKGETEVFADGKLIISQINGTHAVHAEHLKSLYSAVKDAEKAFAKVTYVCVPPENAYIRVCDWLCIDALDAQKQNRTAAAPAICTPIGTVSSPFVDTAPNQGRNTEEISTITLDPAYTAGLAGLSEGDDIFVLCWFDKAERDLLSVTRRGKTSGVFARRSPARPNPVSLTLVRLLEVSGNILKVRGLEAFDGTPVLDIKPYVAGIDTPEK
jgi:tRNA-Thr(GGU) m(6)t(6)A37 methyltransferase TsaA